MSQVIRQALQWDIWHPLDDTTCYQSIALCHYGMAQRWLVVSSQAALERADKSVANAQQRELEQQRYETERQRRELEALQRDRYYGGDYRDPYRDPYYYGY